MKLFSYIIAFRTFYSKLTIFVFFEKFSSYLILQISSTICYCIYCDETSMHTCVCV